jgi:hypothetical protein
VWGEPGKKGERRREGCDEHACGERRKTFTGSQLGRQVEDVQDHGKWPSQWAAGPVLNADAHSAHAGMA